MFSFVAGQGGGLLDTCDAKVRSACAVTTVQTLVSKAR